VSLAGESKQGMAYAVKNKFTQRIVGSISEAFFEFG